MPRNASLQRSNDYGKQGMWKSLAIDTIWYMGLGVICGLLGIYWFPHGDSTLAWQLWGVAILISIGCGLIVSLLTLSPVHNTLPVAMPLIGMMIRTGVYVGALLLVGATKWSHQNYFTNCLLACYFPFLALESLLSIRRSSPR